MRMILVAAIASLTFGVSQASGQQAGEGNRGTGSGAAANMAIAFLSPERAFTESAPGKAALAQFGKLQAETSRAIEQKNEALRARQSAYDASAAVLSAAARSERQKELQKFQIDVERFIEVAQADLVGARRELESAFLAKLKPAVEQVAKARGLQLVINADTGVLVWGQPSLDITSDVVTALSAPAVK